MNQFLFLTRELLGAIRTRSGVLFSFAILRFSAPLPFIRPT